MWNTITSWIANKGLDVSADTLKKCLSIKSREFLIQEEMQNISARLDAIIEAPYQQAVMHLREGELEKCKDKLMEAISLNELNLPAMLLYADILRFKKNYVLALDYYWDVLEKFGFRQDLVPPPLFYAYNNKFFKTKILLDDQREIILSIGDEKYPEEIWCSLNGFAVRWKSSKKFLGITLYESSIVEGYSWAGDGQSKKILGSSQSNPTIGMMTNRYAVVKEASDRFMVYRLFDGSKVPKSLSLTEFRSLFQIPEASKEILDKCRTTGEKFIFSNLIISKDIYEFSTTSTYRGGGYGHPYRTVTSTHNHRQGRLIINPQK
ncbi:MAG: hypothetical protein IGR80_07340 [Synechococcales cyanobacterium K44_A2020_017]|nr:hypothetical protein [Synechococcales cyanobacterium K32_A2020_035]MBF2094558.1 hypothetical protein [Synechococcales cyanobacterium K44_A2020_017]